MNRRDLIAGAGAVTLLASVSPAIAAGPANPASPLPAKRRIRVAFMLGANANVIDTAGPWEVFQDTAVGRNYPFQLYTVGATSELVRMTGGMQVKPDYTVANAPQPDVIVVPAQKTSNALLAWLRAASPQADVTMSVCTGAFQLARAGLLEGIPATTHHQFWNSFAAEFPAIELRRGPRFVDSGRIATAGGLTSGIDMALHIVRRYFGDDVAATTARYMEHSSEAWRAG